MRSLAFRSVRAAAATVAVLTASFVAACSPGGGAQPPASPAPSPPVAVAASPVTAPPAPPVAVPTCEPVHVPPWSPANFRDPTTVTNSWMPLVPGTQYTEEGSSNVNGKPTEHKIVFTVTDLVKQIDGVQTLVGWDVDTDKGVLAESELVFFAQDNDGNVWTVGEYPEEYKAAKLTGAPWPLGRPVDEKPPSSPASIIETGECSASPAPFLDCAKDVSTGQHLCARRVLRQRARG